MSKEKEELPEFKNEELESIYNALGDNKVYNKDRINNIHKMEAIWGTEALMRHCEITAFKYRDRIGSKPNQSLKQEVLKAQWYEKAALYFFNKINENEHILGIDGGMVTKMDLPWKKI